MNKITLPGLIDPYVQLSDPQQETAAAVSGGYTTILDIPNTNGQHFTLEKLKQKKKLAAKTIISDVGFFFESTDENTSDFVKAVHEGVYGLQLRFDHSDILRDKKSLEKIIRAWPVNHPVLVPTDERTLTEVIEIGKRLNRKIHFCHLSTKFELKQILQAKEEGVKVTCGVTPYHLFLNDRDSEHLKAFGHTLPALRSTGDVAFLWKHLRVIDCIETDPLPRTQTDNSVKDQAGANTGLETTLPLLLTAVKEGKLEMHEIIRLCHDGPARIFNVRQGKGTYIEIDLKHRYTIENKQLISKKGRTPFHGWKVQGRIEQAYIREKQVYAKGDFLLPPGSGTVI